MAFRNILQTYAAPDWIRKSLSNIPRYRVQLGNLDTPIHKWNLPDVPEGFEVYIKRDDMTGSTLSGNKVRKLEFLLADAISRGCCHVITCGAIQSNHCRATAIAAAQLGLKTHLVLRADLQSTAGVGCQGNVLLDRLCGAAIYVVPNNMCYKTGLLPRMERIAQHIKQETGEESYLIPVGGSDGVGLYGYLEGFNELLTQGVPEQFDDIVFACGSGGTADGLALGNYLTKSKLKIHGVTVSDNRQYFLSQTAELLTQLRMEEVKAADIMDLIDGYKGQGYALSTPQELGEFYLLSYCRW
ncbi:hypothetical protein NP493_1335g00002 [Ridgeia piscesae]|uniref:Tryptophan synthase beta chain-like PALP domain-containing protein n=1 Tax=Ridgeia piscesae TaxID=27915 RepID=A0AAD9K6T2_RIDPI|nr:hypothetical protein NP493_1335g00002 [Ridgeia piscesae]